MHASRAHDCIELRTANGLANLCAEPRQHYRDGDQVVVETNGQYHVGVYRRRGYGAQIQIGRVKLSLKRCSIVGVVIMARLALPVYLLFLAG